MNKVARFGQRAKFPARSPVEGKSPRPGFQKYTFHLIQVVLQAIQIPREQSRSKLNLEHHLREKHFHPCMKAPGRLKYLGKGRVPFRFDDLSHDLLVMVQKKADTVLDERAVYDCLDQITHDGCHFSPADYFYVFFHVLVF